MSSSCQWARLRGNKSFTRYILVNDFEQQRLHWTKKWVQLSILRAQQSRHVVWFHMWVASLACCTQITSINTSAAQLEPLYTTLHNNKVTESTGKDTIYDWGRVQYAQTYRNTLSNYTCHHSLSALELANTHTHTHTHTHKNTHSRHAIAVPEQLVRPGGGQMPRLWFGL